MPASPIKKWTISDEQRAVWPDLSGNQINGLGEQQSRRPSMVYWPNDMHRSSGMVKDGSEHPFADVIRWFRTVTPATTPTYTDFKKRAPRELDPVASVPIEDKAESWTARSKEFVLANDGELVGVTRLNPEWFYEDLEPSPLPWVIMIGCAMDYDKMQHMPPSTEDPTSAIEVGEIYNKVDRAAGTLANWIRSQGYNAENQGGPSSGSMVLIPPALECGFGELGKHGSIINRKLGSLLRLSAVRTDLPLLPDYKDDLAVDDFCTNCRACSKACPPVAISDEKQWVRGEQKWYVNFDACVPYFNENYACGICIAVCPWSRPGVAPRLAEKMLKRRADRKA
jgi:epoxyqueuosine reductase